MKRIVRIIIVLFLFSPLLTNSGENVYAASESRLYELKVKLKPKAVKSLVYVGPKILSDITFRTTPVLFSRDMDADLKEFPIFKLESEFKNRVPSKLLIYLGIDYTGDNIIDDCLKFEDVNVCEYNIFKLAKSIYGEITSTEYRSREVSNWFYADE